MTSNQSRVWSAFTLPPSPPPEARRCGFWRSLLDLLDGDLALDVSQYGLLTALPDAKTVLFASGLGSGATERFFDRFADVLEAHGYEAGKGQIIDAAIVNSPVQRNRREDSEKIKQGEVPEEWPENKRRQKDSDARWTTKHGKSYYGYKNHISSDAEERKIRSEFGYSAHRSLLTAPRDWPPRWSSACTSCTVRIFTGSVNLLRIVCILGNC